MNEARPYASLSSGLLARKGAAKPAMRPQGFGQGYGNLEDLGWNDMGHGPDQPAAPPPPTEHVPSSIAALTPAPKIQRTNPTDEHLPPDAEGYEAIEGEEALEEEAIEEAAAFEPPAEAEPAAEIEAEQLPEPNMFEQPLAEEPIAAEPIASEPIAPEPVAAEPIAREPVLAEPEPEAAPPEAIEPAKAAPLVVEQQRAILQRFDGLEEAETGDLPAASRDAHADIVPLPQRAAKVDRRKAAFTLRLDAERHLRLRLACAVTRHSAQQIVARALDEALASIPEIEALASQVPAKPGRASKK